MPDRNLERRYLDRAIRCLGLQPSDQVERSETPDFLIPFDSKIIGVEVTTFHLPKTVGQSHAARKAMQELAVEQARRKHNGLGGTPLYVTVCMTDVDISKSRAYEIGAQLAWAVRRTKLPTTFSPVPVWVSLALLPSEVVEVSLHASPHGKDELWRPGMAGWVDQVQSQHVEAEIARKAKRLPVIRQKCTEAWLLIVNDVFQTIAPCELSDKAAATTFYSPFERTLWLDSSGLLDLGVACPRVWRAASLAGYSVSER